MYMYLALALSYDTAVTVVLLQQLHKTTLAFWLF